MSSSQLTFIFFRRGRVQPPTSHVSHVVSLGGTSHARWALPVKSWSKNKCVGELNGTRAKSVVASVLVKIRRPMINGVTTKGKSTPETIDCNFSHRNQSIEMTFFPVNCQFHQGFFCWPPSSTWKILPDGTNPDLPDLPQNSIDTPLIEIWIFTGVENCGLLI